jgi:hypothetical protein
VGMFFDRLTAADQKETVTGYWEAVWKERTADQME